MSTRVPHVRDILPSSSLGEVFDALDAARAIGESRSSGRARRAVLEGWLLPEDEETLRAMSYADYLRTDVWRELARRTKRAAGELCELCDSPRRLDAHHLTYIRCGGREWWADLICLCHSCHFMFHRVLKIELGGAA